MEEKDYKEIVKRVENINRHVVVFNELEIVQVVEMIVNSKIVEYEKP